MMSTLVLNISDLPWCGYVEKGEQVKKKKLKQKCKLLQQERDKAVCEYIRLKYPDGYGSKSDEQIIKEYETAKRVVAKVAEAVHRTFAKE